MYSLYLGLTAGVSSVVIKDQVKIAHQRIIVARCADVGRESILKHLAAVDTEQIFSEKTHFRVGFGITGLVVFLFASA